MGSRRGTRARDGRFAPLRRVFLFVRDSYRQSLRCACPTAGRKKLLQALLISTLQRNGYGEAIVVVIHDPESRSFPRYLYVIVAAPVLKACGQMRVREAGLRNLKHIFPKLKDKWRATTTILLTRERLLIKQLFDTFV